MGRRPPTQVTDSPRYSTSPNQVEYLAWSKASPGVRGPGDGPGWGSAKDPANETALRWWVPVPGDRLVLPAPARPVQSAPAKRPVMEVGRDETRRHEPADFCHAEWGQVRAV